MSTKNYESRVREWVAEYDAATISQLRELLREQGEQGDERFDANTVSNMSPSKVREAAGEFIDVDATLSVLLEIVDVMDGDVDAAANEVANMSPIQLWEHVRETATKAGIAVTAGEDRISPLPLEHVLRHQEAAMKFAEREQLLDAYPSLGLDRVSDEEAAEVLEILAEAELTASDRVLDVEQIIQEVTTNPLQKFVDSTGVIEWLDGLRAASQQAADDLSDVVAEMIEEGPNREPDSNDLTSSPVTSTPTSHSDGMNPNQRPDGERDDRSAGDRLADLNSDLVARLADGERATSGTTGSTATSGSASSTQGTGIGTSTGGVGVGGSGDFATPGGSGMPGSSGSSGGQGNDGAGATPEGQQRVDSATNDADEPGFEFTSVRTQDGDDAEWVESELNPDGSFVSPPPPPEPDDGTSMEYTPDPDGHGDALGLTPAGRLMERMIERERTIIAENESGSLVNPVREGGVEHGGGGGPLEGGADVGGLQQPPAGEDLRELGGHVDTGPDYSSSTGVGVINDPDMSLPGHGPSDDPAEVSVERPDDLSHLGGDRELDVQGGSRARPGDVDAGTLRARDPIALDGLELDVVPTVPSSEPASPPAPWERTMTAISPSEHDHPGNDESHSADADVAGTDVDDTDDDASSDDFGSGHAGGDGVAPDHDSYDDSIGLPPDHPESHNLDDGLDSGVDVPVEDPDAAPAAWERRTSDVAPSNDGGTRADWLADELDG